MKIRSVSTELQPKVYALLRSAFPGRDDKAGLVQQLHAHHRPLHEWVCIHTNKVIAYLAFSNAYRDVTVCGLHLAPMAVAPEFQNQGIGSELLRFALRQEPINSQPLFVLGDPGFYQKFGFALCLSPVCPYDKNNTHFLSLHHDDSRDFIIGYEPEFHPLAKSPRAPGLPNRRRR